MRASRITLGWSFLAVCLLAFSPKNPVFAQDSDKERPGLSLEARKDALKALISDRSGEPGTIAFVHQGLLPDPSRAPEFWSVLEHIEERAALDRDYRPHLVAELASRLMPSCRVPYETMAKEIHMREGAGLDAVDEARLAVSQALKTRNPMSTDRILADAAREELMRVTDLTCRVRAPRNGHSMTPVAAMRLADTDKESAPAPQSRGSQTCNMRDNFDF